MLSRLFSFLSPTTPANPPRPNSSKRNSNSRPSAPSFNASSHSLPIAGPSGSSDNDVLISAIEALSAQQRTLQSYAQKMDGAIWTALHAVDASGGSTLPVSSRTKDLKRKMEEDDGIGNESYVLKDAHAPGKRAPGIPTRRGSKYPYQVIEWDCISLNSEVDSIPESAYVASPEPDNTDADSVSDYFEIIDQSFAPGPSRKTLITPREEIIFIDSEDEDDSGGVQQIEANAEPSARSDSGSDSEDDRDIRGRSSLLDQPGLLPSAHGLKGRKWPRKGKNTERGRLQEVKCDLCHGKVHWACASYEDNDHDKGDEQWCCPDCEYKIFTDQEELEVPRAQQERCLRPDCVLKAHKRVRGAGHGDNFIFERIIGRKVVGRNTQYQREYHYLVKYADYEVYDCTWEPPKHIQSLPKHLSTFLRACAQAGVNPDIKVALLPEAEGCWNEQGLRRRAMLVQMGVRPAEWWRGENEKSER